MPIDAINTEVISENAATAVQAVEVLKTDVTDKGAWEQFFSTVPSLAMGLVGRVVIALVLYVVGTKIISFVTKIVRKSLDKAGLEKGALSFIVACVRFTLYGVLVLTVASSFGFDATSIVAVIGSFSIAVGLALQGSFSNLAGGVLILLLKPFVVGDYIMDHSNGREGTVTDIQIFYTTLLTVDNKAVLIPNGALSNNSITNLTKLPKRRIDFSVGISYESDLKLAKSLLKGICERIESRLKDTEVEVFVRELGDSAVVLGARVWIPTDQYWPIFWKLNEDVKLCYDENGISIPYSQLDVHLDGSLSGSK
ncbi:MAG: mechanosensitive ion channel [Lachnospiraceae bacterium]|nr:mechanosensitive ion channel [Lachnospiraceae bacterium]